jgi:glutamate N-acetyltransferase / amino-acid N-acetyltransferase
MIQPTIETVRGFRAVGVSAGIKYADRYDLALIVSERPCVAAGVFTTNQIKAAPVLACQSRLATHADQIRAVVVNSGYANAMTGAAGLADAEATTAHVAQRLDVPPEAVLPLSTGVIGERLPLEKLKAGVDQAVGRLGDHWLTAAQAIMTTDTRPKLCAVTVGAGEGAYTVAGVAKGAGMIAPDMATMLAVIVTDATLTPAIAQATLRQAAHTSFNRIVVDGDMSTNDTVLLLANGTSPAENLDQFQHALNQVCQQLALSIVQDGEGATKFITISVHGAPDDEAARRVAQTLATSALVKTAFFGQDANWGRVAAAIGRAGVPLDPAALNISIAPGRDANASRADLTLVQHGVRADYREADAAKIMTADEITLTVELGQGDGWGLVWTTDFSTDYVHINADYRS